MTSLASQATASASFVHPWAIAIGSLASLHISDSSIIVIANNYWTLGHGIKTLGAAKLRDNVLHYRSSLLACSRSSYPREIKTRLNVRRTSSSKVLSASSSGYSLASCDYLVH